MADVKKQAYYRAHREARLGYYRTNREQRLAYQKAYYEATKAWKARLREVEEFTDPEAHTEKVAKYRAYQAEYYRKNRDRIRQKRRQKRQQARLTPNPEPRTLTPEPT